jgi:replication factor A1
LFFHYLVLVSYVTSWFKFVLPLQGNNVHAQNYPPLPERFKHLLKEGKVYNLSFVQIKKVNRLYKPVENDIMINFTRWTTVEEIVSIPPAFPIFTYSLIPIEKLPSRADNREYFTGMLLYNNIIYVYENRPMF